MSLAWLPEFLSYIHHHAYWVSMITPMLLLLKEAQLWRFGCRNPFPNTEMLGKSSHSLELLFRVSPTHAVEKSKSFYLLLSRFFPLQRFDGHKEPLIMLSPTLTFVASSGFYTLSTPYSPCYLLGLFHPSSVLGVNPSRPYPPNVVVRFLKRRNLHGVEISVKIIPSFKV